MSTTVLAAIGVIVLFLVGRHLLAQRRFEAVRGEIEEALKGGARLLDVRTPSEFAAGHLDGATNIPLGDLERRLKEVGPKTRGVVVCCHSGARSQAAASLLRSKGYTRVYDIGPMAWGRKLRLS